MSADTSNRSLKRAEMLAQRAIESGVAGHRQKALDEWSLAEALVARHQADSDFHQWLRTGLADALCEVGQYARCLQVVAPARAWCVSIGQPLASICVARALWGLGRLDQVSEPLNEAVRLGGMAVLEHFEPQHRPALEALLVRA